MKKILLTCFALIAFLQAYSQTNVSGGINNNTIWTLSNSPYIVTDNIVVFPNVQLTIEAGVVVKFADHKTLELRQAAFTVNGTLQQPVVFTSNASSPSPGIWEGILVSGNPSSGPTTLSYANFSFAKKALNSPYNTGGDTAIKLNYCTFSQNKVGAFIYANYLVADHCLFSDNDTAVFANHNLYIINSQISNNRYGIRALSQASIIHNNVEWNTVVGIMASCYSTIKGNPIRFNKIGYENAAQCGTADNIVTQNTIEYNDIGILILQAGDAINCNKINSNTSFGLKNMTSTNFKATNNYWGTNDSAAIASAIYDGYDNVNMGLITFKPLDNTSCYVFNSIQDELTENQNFKIYPNPASNNLYIDWVAGSNPSTIYIFNLLGQVEKILETESDHVAIDISALKKGIHIIEIRKEQKVIQQKIIVE